MRLLGIGIGRRHRQFGFLGGSMGEVVGERVARAVETAGEKRIPALLFTSSGGARMHEGVISLMQMAKVSAVLSQLAERRIPYVSILTNPTTGGVSASFAMLGDAILAEPGAVIGFAGPRVIKQTLGQDLPEGFQTAEFLRDHGMVDCVVHRRDLKTTVARLLRPLFRVLLRHSMSFIAFEELAKRVYIEVAMQDFAIEGKKPTISRASILSGLTRKEVQRLLTEPAMGDDADTGERYNRAARVLTGWVRDAAYYVELSGSPQTLGSDASYLRFYGRAERVWKLGGPWHLRTRGEIGTSWIDEFSELPASQRFFAGGDRSVRGFGLNELSPPGPPDENGNPTESVGGENKLIASIEIEHDLPRDFRVAVFYDTGNAFNDWADQQLEYSVGIGVRWKLPMLMIGIDVAQALSEPDKNPRLHLNITQVLR